VRVAATGVNCVPPPALSVTVCAEPLIYIAGRVPGVVVSFVTVNWFHPEIALGVHWKSPDASALFKSMCQVAATQYD
jgi:hypothetical protein